MIAVIGGFVATCIGFSGVVVGLSGVTQRGASKKQRYASFWGVLLCLSLLAAIALFIYLVDAGVIDWIKG
ncbi:hypothetical protein [Schaalia dentiphila]|uniref:Uncharacterized protein n=1 Tax=Schaalia dentiphila ATCC 17982 TaxID=411466 RepID=A7BB08_9ACTO|nr:MULTISPECIES: hypothetical protein [Schaalia]EDN80382.1 hypothetical protein ACTODO_00825 [Schaalia odontolytica ATCC 17982]